MKTSTEPRALWRSSLLAIVMGLGLTSCLEREETLTVSKDGSLSVVLRWRGDKEDLDGGAARLPDPTVYGIQRTTELDEDGDEKHVLTASADFGRAADLPTRFGRAADPLAAAALTSGTDVQIRREGKRTYYKFERRYEPRNWATYRVFRRRAFPDDIRELIEDDNLWRRSYEDRRKVIRATIFYERMKLQYWAEQCMARVAPDHPRLLEGQLEVRAAIARRIDAELTAAKLLRLVTRSPQEIHAWSQDVYKRVDQLMVMRAKEHLKLDDAKVKEFEKALALIRNDYDVTQDLEDEAFTLKVKLPGRVIGHNADGVEGAHVVWHFDGHSIRDRAHTLVAISVLEDR